VPVTFVEIAGAAPMPGRCQAGAAPVTFVEIAGAAPVPRR